MVELRQMQEAAHHGLQALLLDCHAENREAVRFYDRLGYRVLGLIMEKSISSEESEV